MEKNIFIVDNESQGLRLDVFLCQKHNELSRTQAQRIIDNKQALVNKEHEKASYRLETGDEVICEIPDPQPLEVEAENIPLDIIYEDTDLLVVNKPQGMVVHPANGNYNGTLVNALLYHCRDLSGINGVLRPGIIHRIDKDTSGLILVAKNDRAHQNLSQQLKEHSVKRIYIALLHGIVQEPGGIIEAPIGRSLKDRQKMAVVSKNSKEAVTEYLVLERLGEYTLVECKLRTGRTHQIRVHMAFINHPVVGDPKYGHKKEKLELKGQALHARTIGFAHPRKGDWLEFSVAPPPIYLRILKELGSNFE
ncbi:MAG: RNA pseudouridine synthase [Firmicutes bacterium HGW-Firmicutes-12]|jgi:23S rRNA pseudouridine1911/1915/1917 synthase|nr:MAG: RNA pseudouridine synthase [Firmicutes bacterium HGW-Firmicutes-12]